MKTMIFQHRTMDWIYGLINAESTKQDLPDKFWEYLGLVDVKNEALKEQLINAEELLQIDIKMFEVAPELNEPV